MNEFVEQFLIECRELVDQATDDLLALEENPGDRERLDSAFRAFHTLKGAAGIVDFAAMGEALHAAESVLASVRAEEQPITSALIGDGLTCIDQVVQWLDEMERTGEPPADASRGAQALIARFAGYVAPSDAASPADPVPTAPPVVEGSGFEAGALEGVPADLIAAQLAMLTASVTEGWAGRTESAVRVTTNLLHSLGRHDEADRVRALAAGEGGMDRAVLIDVLQRLQRGPLGAEAPPAERDAPEPAARGLRVEVERIDALVSLTGELMVSSNALAYAAQLAQETRDPAALSQLLKDQHAVLNRLVGRLQQSVLNIRVLPLRQVFQRFPRLVREIVVQLGKPARLVTEGEGTEADKAVVEALFEPLLHVLRNALDHGVEPADVRAARGKPPSATVVFRAARQGDRVVVEVEDDGGGVDVERVRQVAAARGLVTPEDAAALSDAAVVDLIFAPGFSTAAQVSSVSGRGVGMDAVRSAVERLGGRVQLENRPGEGALVRFVLPFTVMMTQVVTVEAGGQTFGIPLESVVETVRLQRSEVQQLGGATAFALRDRTLPLIPLAEAVGAAQGADPGATEVHVVVVAAPGGGVFGLEVDGLGERVEVMLKPMDGLLAGAPGVAGATLLGDGRVLVVLDVHDLLA